MSAEDITNNRTVSMIRLPKSLDSATLAKVKRDNLNLMKSTEIWFDFALVTFVAKSFYPSLHSFRKEIVNGGITLRSVNLSAEIKSRFMENGTFSFLNYSMKPKKAGFDVDFVQPFIDTTILVLQAQSKIQSRLLTPHLKSQDGAHKVSDIAGIVKITSEGTFKTISWCFPKDTFLNICFQRSGERQEDITSDVEATAAEILSMIVIGAKDELHKRKNYEIEKALPTIVRGSLQAQNPSRGATMILPFTSEAGDFHIEIELVTTSKILEARK